MMRAATHWTVVTHLKIYERPLYNIHISISFLLLLDMNIKTTVRIMH